MLSNIPALCLIVAGICGIIPKLGPAAWPFVLVGGLVWLLT